MRVVSDAGPLHYLVLIGRDGFLPQLFERVLIPRAVVRELSHPRTPERVHRWIADPPEWIEVHDIGIPEERRGQGEREAILLAETSKADAVLLDDRIARRTARARGLTVYGTLGILEQAALEGWIDLRETIHELLETNFRADQRVIDRLLGDSDTTSHQQ